jgi:CHASE3 domain sensor protein
MSFQAKYEAGLRKAQSSFDKLELEMKGNPTANETLTELKAELAKIKETLEARKANKSAKK